MLVLLVTGKMSFRLPDIGTFITLVALSGFAGILEAKTIKFCSDSSSIRLNHQPVAYYTGSQIKLTYHAKAYE